MHGFLFKVIWLMMVCFRVACFKIAAPNSSSSPWAYNYNGFFIEWIMTLEKKCVFFCGILQKINVQLYHLGNSHFLHITEITQTSIVTVKFHFSFIYPSVCSSVSVFVCLSQNLSWLLLKNNRCFTLQEWLVSSILVVHIINIYNISSLDKL